VEEERGGKEGEGRRDGRQEGRRRKDGGGRREEEWDRTKLRKGDVGKGTQERGARDLNLCVKR
jgi:hypothetical protein